MRTPTYVALLLMLVSPFASATQSAATIETEIIGSFGGYQQTIPTGINNNEEIVGFVQPTGTMAGVNAFLWTRQGGFQLLAEDAVATDINDRGDVTGYRYECTQFPDGGGFCNFRGFVWNGRTGFIDLVDFVPTAINNSGDMAGECSAAGGLAACAIHRGIRTQWECELEDCSQRASGINARGDVVGMRASPGFEFAMLFPRRGTPVVLGAQTAEDINNAGTVAGRAPTSLWPSNATLWTNKGLVQAPSADTTIAVALNERGWAAGIRFGSDAPNASFFWDGSGNTLVNLAPEAVSSEALDINDRGQIVGTIGTITQSQQLVIWRVHP
jgi:uncharacterized membrane protein